MLAGIFLCQLVILVISFAACIKNTPSGRSFKEICPDLGQRTEQLFGVAIATTLSLFAGEKAIRQAKKDRDDEPAPRPSSQSSERPIIPKD